MPLIKNALWTTGPASILNSFPECGFVPAYFKHVKSIPFLNPIDYILTKYNIFNKFHSAFCQYFTEKVLRVSNDTMVSSDAGELVRIPLSPASAIFLLAVDRRLLATVQQVVSSHRHIIFFTLFSHDVLLDFAVLQYIFLLFVKPYFNQFSLILLGIQVLS